MIVVCDTSPSTSLAAIGQFDPLHRLYGRVHIAEGVWLGLQVVGVVGILLEAKSQGAITALRPCLGYLRQTARFFLDDLLYARALDLAGEQRSHLSYCLRGS